ncbi:MAG: MOFRL family protein [Chloroflexota bacterium]
MKDLEAADFLANNDSYTYFNQLGDHLIVTGQTGTNVNDLLFIMRY